MLHLCSFGQVVSYDEGVTCLLQGRQEFKCLVDSILNYDGRFPIGRILHGRSLSRSCVGLVVPPDTYDHPVGCRMASDAEKSPRHLLAEVRLYTHVANLSGNVLHHESHPLVRHGLIRVARP
jgi:hypothetical protein